MSSLGVDLNVSGNAVASSFRSISGSIAGSTAFQTIFTLTSGQRGFVTVIGSSNNAMSLAFFEWTSGITNVSVNPIVNNPAGLTFQIVSTSIQVRNTLTGGTTFWYVTFL